MIKRLFLFFCLVMIGSITARAASYDWPVQQYSGVRIAPRGASSYTTITAARMNTWDAAAGVMHTTATLAATPSGYVGTNYMSLLNQQFTAASIDLGTSNATGILSLWHLPFQHSLTNDYTKVPSSAAVYSAIAASGGGTISSSTPVDGFTDGYALINNSGYVGAAALPTRASLGLDEGDIPTFYSMTLTDSWPVLDIVQASADQPPPRYFGVQIRNSISNDILPMLAMGGQMDTSPITYTHAWLEDNGTLKILDADSSTTLSHDGSTWTMYDPLHLPRTTDMTSSTRAATLGDVQAIVAGIGTGGPYRVVKTVCNYGDTYPKVVATAAAGETVVAFRVIADMDFSAPEPNISVGDGDGASGFISISDIDTNGDIVGNFGFNEDSEQDFSEAAWGGYVSAMHKKHYAAQTSLLADTGGTPSGGSFTVVLIIEDTNTQ